jgi:peptide/nickel transport system ATP-binding protein/oligopeptide transport system ATP-binding protein
MSSPLISVEGLKKHFTVNDGLLDRLLGDTRTLKAVDGISFDVERGETIGLVGESGSGKSTAARSILQLETPTAGSVTYQGTDLTTLSAKEMKRKRRELQMVFQDPASSLNRRKTIAQTIRQPMKIHGLHQGERSKRVVELLETVGLSAQFANQYPHELSGGQQQRVGIARALAVDPEVLVCDEPVSALDVSLQAQILNLLDDLQNEFGLTILFIAHDLSVIRHICDRVAVMYLGKIVEIAETKQLFRYPQHPYTKALLQSIPEPDPTISRERESLPGQVPSPIDPPTGCSFHTRCPEATQECKRDEPPLQQVEGATEGHAAACIYAREFDSQPSGTIADIEGSMDRYSEEGFRKQDPLASGDD